MFRKDKDITYGVFDPEIHTEDNPLVMKNYHCRGLTTMVRMFIKFTAWLYGLNRYGMSCDIVEEIEKMQSEL